jgi:hypothetical protein
VGPSPDRHQVPGPVSIRKPPSFSSVGRHPSDRPTRTTLCCPSRGRTEPSVVRSHNSGIARGHGHGRRGYRNRGVAAARFERAREQKPSRRAQAAHAWIWAKAFVHRIADPARSGDSAVGRGSSGCRAPSRLTGVARSEIFAIPNRCRRGPQLLSSVGEGEIDERFCECDLALVIWLMLLDRPRSADRGARTTGPPTSLTRLDKRRVDRAARSCRPAVAGSWVGVVRGKEEVHRRFVIACSAQLYSTHDPRDGRSPCGCHEERRRT